MPELPEVETICRELRGTIEGKTITRCDIFRPDYLRGGDAGLFIDKVVGNRIEKIIRRGKYIVWELKGAKVVSHLGMTGKYIHHDRSKELPKHTVALFDFDDITLILNDVRRFGRLNIYLNGEIINVLEKLGAEPLSKDLTLKYISAKFKDRKRQVKELLLDQSIIAGIGNIYASEILFDSHIHPSVPGDKLTKPKLNRIIDSTRKILEASIENAGTTISDYKRVDDKSGGFQNFLKVYGKEGADCIECQSEVKKIVFGGRSTFYCPKCQKK